MPIKQIPLIQGNKLGIITDYCDNLFVNMYAIEREILGTKGYVVNYPGLRFYTTGQGVDRGAIYNERLNKQFRISGTSLISIGIHGDITILGTIPGNSQCNLNDFYSFNTQGIIANGRMFLYGLNLGFQEITDSNLGAPIDGIWIDGYYFLTDGEYVYHTDLDDETAIDPLKFATAEFMPDPSLGIAKTQDNKVLVFGRYSLEYFINDSSSNFAFSRVETRAQKIGIVATHAKCEADGYFYIVGGRREEAIGVHVISIGASQKVSTREIDKILANYSELDLSNIRMESFTKDGTTFILIHLPNETLCLNVTTIKTVGLLSSWSLLSTGIIGLNPYRAINGIFDARIGKWVFGDKINSNIGILDSSICTQYSDLTEWQLYTPLLVFDGLSVDEIELKTIPGFTTTEDATVAISLTYDGIIYGQEWWEMYGEPKDHNKRFIIQRLGYVSNIVGFKFRGVSTSKMAFALMVISYG